MNETTKARSAAERFEDFLGGPVVQAGAWISVVTMGLGIVWLLAR